jgi:hypothetical protein
MMDATEDMLWPSQFHFTKGEQNWEHALFASFSHVYACSSDEEDKKMV